MSSDFECFVTINDRKHTIIIHKDIEDVAFGDVYQQIKRIDTKDQISYETHVFECFDFDTNSYKRLTSFNQLIKYLSRIRVLAKNENTFKSNDFLGNKRKFEDKYEIQQKSKYLKSFRENPAESYDYIRTNRPINPLPQSRQSSNRRQSLPQKKITIIDPKARFMSQTMASTSGQSQQTYCPKGANHSIIDCFRQRNGQTDRAQTRIQTTVQSSEPLDPMIAIKNEEYYEVLDKQFMTELLDKNDLKAILSRRQESKKFNDNQKRQLIGHGIRLNLGFGPQSYICLKCQQWFPNSDQMLSHYRSYGEMASKAALVTRIRNEEKKSKLAEEGIVWNNKCYYCRFCSTSLSNDMNESLKHIYKDKHKEKKSFKGIDRLLVSELTTNDNNILISRKKSLESLDSSDKEKALIHGIKVMDGKGDKAFVCTACNIFISSGNGVKRHLDQFLELDRMLANELKNSIEIKIWAKKQIKLLKENDSNSELIANLFRNEGIEYWKPTKSMRKSIDFHYKCLFCDFSFDNNDDVIDHLNGSVHKKVKRGEYLQSIDAMFVTESQRIDDFDVAFARMQALYKLDTKSKLVYRDEGIRLKDGVGAEAYLCFRCKFSFGAPTVDTAIDSIRSHINGRNHRSY